jgi:hypothetical protein
VALGDLGKQPGVPAAVCRGQAADGAWRRLVGMPRLA